MPGGRRKPLVIGITGGIASGKSTVAKLCAAQQGQGAGGGGATVVIDADLLGHRSYEKGTPCFRQLVKHFGDRIVGDDGAIDRRALGGIVFADPAKRKELEGIVWPEIRRLMEQDIQALGETGTATAVVEAAVMLEAGWQDAMDEVWVVAVEPDLARQRLMARNKLTAEEADRRIRSQMTNQQRVAFADRVIWNNGTAEELERAVAEAWAERGTLRRSKAAAKARWRMLAALVGFSVLASVFRLRAAGR